MNALDMLKRCAAHQHDPDHDAPAGYVTPPTMWREQEYLPDPQHQPLSCEDMY